MAKYKGKDGVINLCEMKFTNHEFEITSDEYKKLLNRLNTFQQEAKPNKAIHITLISANGFRRNQYSNVAQKEISGEELFQM